ncbi:MAG TPA: dihydroxyacetone kinase subunit DhaL [Bacillus sp. (in: firmicutes)]|uniref:dihydroxyacetone kinase subunit DhaL n=1 Tax=Bacillus litorisediminis TaxID=2922713 RepID=UPI001FAF2150|nr:dihydroxyacetone kinase subunit DhaL [Bacillus litorisediminis]HWO76288.1 dihydroxyacetone kinase subunit DhaL [Bacillus sp. (in: firmicutes)]
MLLTVELTKKWMESTNRKLQNHREYLTSLDQAIGDGDHGINMARGFQEVVMKLSVTDYETVSDVLKDVAMILLAKVGGASGPLYSTAFLKMSLAVKGKTSINQTDFMNALDEAINGVIQRGKASIGDKTLLDVWHPVAAFVKETDDINWEGFCQTAQKAMESTKEMMALKGRASYLKERSIGHLDPGSVSSFYLFQSLTEVFTDGE